MTPEEQLWYGTPGRYRVHMDGRWELEDLYLMPHAFEQCYSFIYCFDTDVTPLILMSVQDEPIYGML